jgi:hypothetical protein
VYQTFQNGKWISLEPPPVPKVQYAGYGGPVTDKELRKMLKAQSEEPEIQKKKKKK